MKPFLVYYHSFGLNQFKKLFCEKENGVFVSSLWKWVRLKIYSNSSGEMLSFG